MTEFLNTKFDRKITSNALDRLSFIWIDQGASQDKYCLNERKHPLLPEEGKKNILITAALPYVNNTPHLGNIIGCVLSGDCYSRYCRQRNYNSIYICGTDEYGTTTETKALEENLTPQQICDKYNEIHSNIYKWFRIDFDRFGRTTTQHQTDIAQDIFTKIHKNGYIKEDVIEQCYCLKCQKFLADRFIEGTCPNCNFLDARGDQCDGCGKLINPVELINSKCKICKEVPIIKPTKHLFLDLTQIQDNLTGFISESKKTGHWSNNAKSITNSWLNEGLNQRCISRDLKWGTPIPLSEYKDKVFYVWFDAPIGYISITASYTDQWEKWWKNPDKVKLVQFMAKDNVPFHTVIFPSSLIATGENYTLLNDISSIEYLNYEDSKFSKSRGIGVFGDNAQDSGIDADIFRFYLFYVRPENQDTCFNWSDLVSKVNFELINNLGNFINRSVSFIHKFYGGEVPDFKLDTEDLQLITVVDSALKEYISFMEIYKMKDSLRIILEIGRYCNLYIQDNAPWVLVKGSEAEKMKVKSVCYVISNICALVASMLHPFMPLTSQKIFEQLNLDWKKSLISTDFYPYFGKGHKIGKQFVLFEKISGDLEKDLKTKYSGNKNKAKPPVVDIESLMKLSQLEISEKIKEKGDLIRSLKSKKANKEVIDNEVAVLLALKSIKPK